MSVNLVELLEKKVQQTPMKLIDPNTQAAGDENEKSSHYLYQRGIMAAALVGLFQFSRDEANLNDLLKADNLNEFPDRIFDHDFSQLENRVKAYSGYNKGQPREDFEHILHQAVDILREQAGADARKAKDFLSDQRTNILSYIPKELETGSMVGDSTLDDRTNKMHGPFSDFTHWMGQLFSRSDK